MTRRVHRHPILGIAAGFALAVGAAAQVNVSNSPGRESISPRIVTDSQGNAHAVWVEKTGSASGDVFYAKGTVATLQITTPVNLSNSNAVYCDTQEMCAVAVDGSDRVYVVWTEGWGGASSIKVRTYANGTWDTPMAVATGLRLQSPRIAAGPDGNLYLVWWNNQWQVYSTARVNGTWESPRMISREGLTSKMADIDMGTNIVGVALAEKNYAVGDYYQTGYTQRGTGFDAPWTSVVLVDPKVMNQQHPAVRVDTADTAHVVWTDESGTRTVRYARKSGSGFLPSEAISPDDMLHYPFMSKQGTEIYVVWQVGNYGGGSSVDYNILGSDGVWKGRQEVPNSGGVTYCDIAASPDKGIVYFLWDVALGTPNAEIFGYAKVGARPNPALTVSRSRLAFGAVAGGPATSAQKVLVANSGGAKKWAAASAQNWIQAAPASGTGSGAFEISVQHAGLAPGSYQGSVLVSDPDAPQYAPATIAVTLVVYGTAGGSAPFGSFDSPSGSATLFGSIPVTGWALDDVGIQTVGIYRDPVTGEPAGRPVYIGEAVFVEGARPDVEQAYPAVPQNHRAGWGYMMLSNFLPNKGNGTFVLRVLATDKEGRTVELGARTVVCDNANAVKPFGTIDTPAQGGTVSGTKSTVFGWALTPQPNNIPVDGSTIGVWVDGLLIGRPTYNNFREDIATLFPGYANSNGAVGYYHLDTTSYGNGIHTLAWSVVDSAGNTTGIGSRFFSVLNVGATASAQASGARGAPDNLSGPTTPLAPLVRSPMYGRRGYGMDRSPDPVYPNGNGEVVIPVVELERVEVWVDRAAWENGLAGGWREGRPRRPSEGPYRGYWLVSGELRALPPGSTFDSVLGMFAWQPGPGFLGDYAFIFVNERNGTRQSLRIRISPKF